MQVSGSKYIFEVCSFDILWNTQVVCVPGSSTYCHRLSRGVFKERERIRERKSCCCLDVFLLHSDVAVSFISLGAHQIVVLSCLKILEVFLNPQVSLIACSIWNY